jgi:hypothetical protein
LNARCLLDDPSENRFYTTVSRKKALKWLTAGKISDGSSCVFSTKPIFAEGQDVSFGIHLGGFFNAFKDPPALYLEKENPPVVALQKSKEEWSIISPFSKVIALAPSFTLILKTDLVFSYYVRVGCKPGTENLLVEELRKFKLSTLGQLDWEENLAIVLQKLEETEFVPDPIRVSDRDLSEYVMCGCNDHKNE